MSDRLMRVSTRVSSSGQLEAKFNLRYAHAEENSSDLLDGHSKLWIPFRERTMGSSPIIGEYEVIPETDIYSMGYNPGFRFWAINPSKSGELGLPLDVKVCELLGGKTSGHTVLHFVLGDSYGDKNKPQIHFFRDQARAYNLPNAPDRYSKMIFLDAAYRIISSMPKLGNGFSSIEHHLTKVDELIKQ